MTTSTTGTGTGSTNQNLYNPQQFLGDEKQILKATKPEAENTSKETGAQKIVSDLLSVTNPELTKKAYLPDGKVKPETIKALSGILDQLSSKPNPDKESGFEPTVSGLPDHKQLKAAREMFSNLRKSFRETNTALNLEILDQLSNNDDLDPDEAELKRDAYKNQANLKSIEKLASRTYQDSEELNEKGNLERKKSRFDNNPALYAGLYASRLADMSRSEIEALKDAGVKEEEIVRAIYALRVLNLSDESKEQDPASFKEVELNSVTGIYHETGLKEPVNSDRNNSKKRIIRGLLNSVSDNKETSKTYGVADKITALQTGKKDPETGEDIILGDEAYASKQSELAMKKARTDSALLSEQEIVRDESTRLRTADEIRKKYVPLINLIEEKTDKLADLLVNIISLELPEAQEYLKEKRTVKTESGTKEIRNIDFLGLNEKFLEIGKDQENYESEAALYIDQRNTELQKERVALRNQAIKEANTDPKSGKDKRVKIAHKDIARIVFSSEKEKTDFLDPTNIRIQKAENNAEQLTVEKEGYDTDLESLTGTRISQIEDAHKAEAELINKLFAGTKEVSFANSENGKFEISLKPKTSSRTIEQIQLLRKQAEKEMIHRDKVPEDVFAAYEKDAEEKYQTTIANLKATSISNREAAINALKAKKDPEKDKAAIDTLDKELERLKNLDPDEAFILANTKKGDLEKAKETLEKAKDVKSKALRSIDKNIKAKFKAKKRDNDDKPLNFGKLGPIAPKETIDSKKSRELISSGILENQTDAKEFAKKISGASLQVLETIKKAISIKSNPLDDKSDLSNFSKQLKGLEEKIAEEQLELEDILKSAPSDEEISKLEA